MRPLQSPAVEKKKYRIPDKLYFKIGEVSEITGVKPYVLRYWESEFKMVSPSKSRSHQRLYRKADVEMILKIKSLLYEDRFTINGARKKIKELGYAKPSSQSELQFEKKDDNFLIQEVIQELKEIQKLLRE